VLSAGDYWLNANISYNSTGPTTMSRCAAQVPTKSSYISVPVASVYPRGLEGEAQRTGRAAMHREQRASLLAVLPESLSTNQHELDGLMSKEVAGNKVILPVWHGITVDEVRSHSRSAIAMEGQSSSASSSRWIRTRR
jgi:hypothetical protein